MDDLLAPALVLPAISGPTCSGKSDLARRLAERAPVAIVNVDSALVYRGLDIGTAKPDLAERARLPHYMLDLIDPDKRYSAWHYREEFLNCLKDIHAKNLCPLLVGGSMFYFRALMTGLPGASMDQRARDRVGEMAHNLDSLQLYRHLCSLNPEAAHALRPEDRYRVTRALEREYTAPAARALIREIVPIQGFFLAPERRRDLDEPIRARLRGFIRSGLVEEVRELRKNWDLNATHPSMRLAAYRQAFDHLSGRWSVETMEYKAYVATRSVCKRQYTWMRSDNFEFEWMTDSAELEERLIVAIDAYLEARAKF